MCPGRVTDFRTDGYPPFTPGNGLPLSVRSLDAESDSRQGYVTITQQYLEYCERHNMPTDDVGSAAFYCNWRKLNDLPKLTEDEWNDILDYVSPSVLPAVFPVK